jgi:hypothetical protein
MLKNKLNWKDFKIEIKNTNFSNELLESKLDIFWREVIEIKLSENQQVWLLFKLQWGNSKHVTIGKLVKLNKEDKNYLFKYILTNMEDKSEYYKELTIKNMIFSYTIKKGRAKDKINFNSVNSGLISNLEYQYFHHHKLPITMDPLKYGKLLKQIDNIYFVQINRTNTAVITKNEDFNKVEFFKEGELIYEYKDHKVDESTFVRSILNKHYTFKDNKLVILTVEKPVNFIKPLLSLSTLTNKIITLDIETFIKDGIHIPYVICWFDGEKSNSYYLVDFNSSNLLLTQAIKELMVRKYDDHKIYIHNMASFDGIFLLKILVELGNVKPIIHHGDLISINFKSKIYNFVFKDSLQILLVSLRKLAKVFGVDTQKSIFPYSFVNENNLDYIGPVPDFKYFDNITIKEYNEYCLKFDNSHWDLRDEAIKYCEIDCISLYQIIIKFSNMIFDLFKINIHKYPTLSSIAFAIFRTHFLEKGEIPQIFGQIGKDIRQGYTGGAVDMYIPRPPKGTKIFCYDVNSLYPFVMDQFDMPVGKPTQFFGDIRKTDPNAFGFFYCKIIAPDNLLHPILQTHIKTKSGIRTIAPLGTWEDMIFSAEMDNAIKYGYKFEILWGYKFKPKNIFKGYVGHLYSLRLKYPKTNPLNMIAKILLNSLYGRFGMNDSFPNITIFDTFKEFKIWFKDHSEDVIDFMELGDKVLVQHRSENQDNYTDTWGGMETHNVSVGIAAAITAYARIHMSQFKNNPNFNLYYSDTDSIYIDRPLPDEFISSTILGKMKLEYVLIDAIFLAPKVYYLQMEDGKVIYKVKGLKHEVNLSLENFESLLFKESLLEKFQNKWRKNLSEGSIEIRDELYTLRVTNNKRKLIYENNKLVGTLPFTINSNKEVIS